MFKALIFRVWGAGVKCLSLRVRSFGAVSVVGVEVAYQGNLYGLWLRVWGWGFGKPFTPLDVVEVADRGKGLGFGAKG